MGRPGQSNGSLAQAGRRSAHALKMTLTSHLGPAGAGVQSSIDKNRKTRSHVRQLQALGYAVTLTPAA